LPTGDVERLRTRYDTILSKAAAGNPPPPRHPGTHGRVKQSPAYNLIRRLREHRNEVLRSLTDLRVPFDNNQAERDLCMPNLKQKVSGCFRSDTAEMPLPSSAPTFRSAANSPTIVSTHSS